MARLLSVNVGLPRDIAWHGKTVHTAIWKDPVQGRRMVRRLNIDGDGQGDRRVTEASTERCLSTRSSHIDIGRIDSAEAISLTDSSGRTSLLTVCLTTRCVLATGTDRRSLIRGNPAARHLLPRGYQDE